MLISKGNSQQPKRMLFVYALLIAATSNHFLATATEQLTPKTHRSLINSGKNGMIKYYQSWCGHCTAMKPDWDRLAEEAKGMSGVFVADVNCGDQPEICKDVGVEGYPTIKYYKNAEPFDYKGGRGYEALREFVDKELSKKCELSNLDSDACNEKSKTYAKKWLVKSNSDVHKEIKRLEGMKSREMTYELKGWLNDRLNLLAQIATSLPDL